MSHIDNILYKSFNKLDGMCRNNYKKETKIITVQPRLVHPTILGCGYRDVIT